MAGKRKSGGANETVTAHFRHEEKRLNNPPAKIASEGNVTKLPKAVYHYSPHLPPVLRFDPSGAADKLPELIEEAGKRTLTAKEQKLLADALRAQEPWLEWAQKREQHQKKVLRVDPVALHIHERVSAEAIVRLAMREDVQRDLFADPQQPYQEAVQFYKHDVDWANRLILGDSLQVMASLARRENLAGKVQMIYVDPPYGIKFGSNFQPEVGKREVGGKDSDLSREPETVRAYRDTWQLGVHSYLSYLRDRLNAARGLLSDTGSLFLQISDDNLHRVRAVLDEVFGPQNFLKTICVQKTGGLSQSLLPGTFDYILWYSKDASRVKFHQLYFAKSAGADTGYSMLSLKNGERRRMTPEEQDDPSRVPEGSAIFGDTSGCGSFPSAIAASRQGPVPAITSWRARRQQNLERMRRGRGARAAVPVVRPSPVAAAKELYPTPPSNPPIRCASLLTTDAAIVSAGRRTMSVFAVWPQPVDCSRERRR